MPGLTIENAHVTPYGGMDVRTLLQTQAAVRANHPFVIWEPLDGATRSWTYREFVDRIARVAAGLHARGVRAGDRVLVHLDNCPESILSWFGCGWLGAVAVTTNARSSGEELTYFAAHSRAVAGITQPKFAELVAASCPDLRWLAVTENDNGDDPGANRPAHDQSFERLDGDPAGLPQRLANPSAPFAIQYTSGTTSRPKAVLWTHANALWGAQVNARHEDLRPQDVHLISLPLFHTNAQAYSVLATLWVGATCVVQPRFSASRFWPLSLKHGCTWAALIPFCARALMEHPVPDAHQYRLWGNGVSSPPSDAHFRVKTIGWWGMTETISHGTIGSVHLANAPMSCGRPAPGYELRVLTEDGRHAEVGETGELFIRGIRGLSLFAEYVDNPEATAAAFDDEGFFITGDRMRVGADGSLYFADRSKDMLKVGGENVAASEIESVILSVPGVKEAAVVGKPHPMLDEAPVAFVLAHEGAPEGLSEKVMAECQAKLAKFKAPHEIRLVEALPRSTLEKVAKAELRKVLEAEASSDIR